VAAGVALSLPVPAAGAPKPRHRAPEQVPGQYIVVYRGAVQDPVAQTERLERGKGFRARFRYGRALKGFAATLTERQVEELSADPEVLSVHPDRPVRALGSVPLASGDSAPTGVRRMEAATTTTTRPASGVNVAVIDTGIDLDHPDLNAVHGTDCTGSGSAVDGDGHGTHVAGTIAARNNGSGVVGVAPGTRVHAVKVLGDDGNGSWSQVICGIDWVTATRSDVDGGNDIAVANMSLGGVGDPVAACNVTDEPLHRAICASTAAGVTYVVAAGNDGWDFDYAPAPDSPAAYPEVLTVTAVSDSDGRPGGTGGAPGCDSGEGDDRPASFSNFALTSAGAQHTIAAPGMCIRSTYQGDTYGTMSGTSMATPHVAGAVALCLNEGGTNGPCAGKSPGQIVAHMRSTAADRTGDEPAFGFVGDPSRPVGSPQEYYGYLVAAGLASDSIAPTVTSVAPADGADQVSTVASVSVTFSETMDKPATQGAFSLARSGGGSPVTGSFSWSGTTMTFTPSAPLDQATAYTATLGTAAKDTAGNPLAAARTWSFDTAASSPGASDATPFDTVIEKGSPRTGDHDDLQDDDGDLYEVNSTTSGKKRKAIWYGRFEGIPNALQSLEVAFSGRNSLSCNQKVSIFHWGSQSWVDLDARTVGTNETSIQRSVGGALADYVSGSSGNGEVRVRIKCVMKKQNFTASADLLKVTYSPA
jgi:subtilisin family serine protease